jgi:hypothetical protein
MQFTKIIVGIYPQGDLNIEAVKNSKIIAKYYDSSVILDSHGPYPHITLYLSEIPSANISKVIDLLNIKFLETKIQLEFNRISFQKGYLDVELKLNSDLMGLHKQVVEVVNPYREGHIRDKWIREMESYDTGEQQHLKDYGSIAILDTYRPHLTLARLDENLNSSGIISKLEWNWLKSIESQIRLFESGDSGTCIQILS